MDWVNVRNATSVQVCSLRDVAGAGKTAVGSQKKTPFAAVRDAEDEK